MVSFAKWRRSGREHPTDVAELGDITPDHAGWVTDAEVAWNLCETLPPLQRAAVVLRFYDDLDFSAIAGILGCPEATARSHVHRALTRLRSTLIEGSDD